MGKHCRNCVYCEDMSNTITKEFAGFCKLSRSYIHWTWCSQFIAKNTEQQVQPDNGGMCTRPDVFDCHAKVGTGGRCMNIVPFPPLQVN